MGLDRTPPRRNPRAMTRFTRLEPSGLTRRSRGAAGRRKLPSRASVRLRRLIEEALVDAYGEDEQHGLPRHAGGPRRVPVHRARRRGSGRRPGVRLDWPHPARSSFCAGARAAPIGSMPPLYSGPAKARPAQRGSTPTGPGSRACGSGGDESSQRRGHGRGTETGVGLPVGPGRRGRMKLGRQHEPAVRGLEMPNEEGVPCTRVS